MEEAFEKLKKEGKNDVDSLIKWMQESAKVIDNTKAVEEKARSLFADCADKQSVELEKFKAALSKLAEDQKQTLTEFAKRLVEDGPKVLSDAVAAGMSAFKDALTKK